MLWPKERNTHVTKEPTKAFESFDWDEIDEENCSSNLNPEEESDTVYIGKTNRMSSKKTSAQAKRLPHDAKVFSIPSKNIKLLMVQQTSGDVSIRKSANGQIVATGKRKRPQTDPYKDGDDFLVIRNGDETLQLEIPPNIELTVTTTSGDVDINGICNTQLGVTTKSGDINAHKLKTERLSFHSISGDVNFAVSRISTVFGNTTSGNVHLTLPLESASISFSSTSGELFVNDVKCRKRECMLGDGEIKVQVSTVSGDCKIETE